MPVPQMQTSFTHWYPKIQMIAHSPLTQPLERSLLPKAWLTHKIACLYYNFLNIYSTWPIAVLTFVNWQFLTIVFCDTEWLQKQKVWEWGWGNGIIWVALTSPWDAKTNTALEILAFSLNVSIGKNRYTCILIHCYCSLLDQWCSFN